MLLLALTAQRVRSVHPEMARLTFQGDITRALQIGRAGLDRHPVPGNARTVALVGQLLGRCLLAAGHEEDADELFRGMTRHYQDLSRAHVRWLGGLDQGSLMLHMNRPGRAAEALCAVADDPLADPELRVEAMALAAVALHRAGGCRSGWQSLEAARRLAQTHGDELCCRLVDGIGLELAALQRARSAEAIEDHALHSAYHEGVADLPPAAQIQQQLSRAAGYFEMEAPLVARRLAHLAMTPARLIRTRRAEGLRNELCARAGDQKLDERAQRRGLKDRATLFSIHRSRFAETPTKTLSCGVITA